VTTLNLTESAIHLSARLEMPYESGKMTAQDEPSTRHSSGTSGVAPTIMPPRITTEVSKENQNLVYVDRRVRIQGAKY
jgi:hypothetical protein